MTEEVKKRGKYNPQTPEFKAEVVARLKAGERLCDLEHELGIGRGVMYRWRRKLRESGPEVAFRRSGPPVATLKAENEKLRLKLAELREKTSETIGRDS